MDIQNDAETLAYGIEYPRRESSDRRGIVGFLIGSPISAYIFFFLSVALDVAGQGVWEEDPALTRWVIMLLGVAIVLPFVFAYVGGKAESQSAFIRRRDHALGIGPPLNFWYGTTGRMNGTAFIAALVASALGIVVNYGTIQIGAAVDNTTVWVVLLILVIPLAIVSFIVPVSTMVRRLHDMGYSGSYALFCFVPFVFMVLPVVLIVVPGELEPNKYGPQPPKFELRQMMLRQSRKSSSE